MAETRPLTEEEIKRYQKLAEENDQGLLGIKEAVVSWQKAPRRSAAEQQQIARIKTRAGGLVKTPQAPEPDEVMAKVNATPLRRPFPED